MALKLELKSTIIPVEIANFKFEIDMTDTKRKAVEDKFILFTSEVAKLNEEESTGEAKLKDLLKDMYEALLGTEAFDKLYQHTESLDILSNALIHLVIGIKQSLQERIIYNPNASAEKVEKSPRKKLRFGGKE